MKNSAEKKATLTILIAVAVILTIVIVPLVIYNNKEEREKLFPRYDEIDITEDKLNDSQEYINIKERLESDHYFSKFALMKEYDSKNYSSKYLKSMLWDFIFNYERSNNKYLSFSDTENAVYCFKEKILVSAFKELYDVDISKDLSYLPGYYEYVYTGTDGYCLNFGTVDRDYENDISVAVERLTMIGTTITADIYVYEYYNNYPNNPDVERLEEAIKNKDYSNASLIASDTLHGKVTHKQLQFKTISNGNYFKYKLLLSKELVY